MSYPNLKGRSSRGLNLKSSRGFTLIEFSIVMLISAFLMVAAIEVYKVYINQVRYEMISDRQESIMTSLGKFYTVNGRYPCPADPTLGPSDANYGVEDCTLNPITVLSGTCTASGGVCKEDGGRDTEIDGDTNNDPILIGAVPFKTLKDGIGSKSSFTDAAAETSSDPWGYKMGYAVTSYLTDATTFQPSGGAINVVAENGKPVIVPASSVHFVIISYGDDHMGAYTNGGKLNVPCVAGSTESANCNYAGAFVDGVRSMGAGAGYFDDRLKYTSYALATLWGFVPGSTTDIYNKNPGNVGLGVAAPTEKLSVSGIVKSQKADQTQICDYTGANCWSTDIFASPTGMGCTDTATTTGVVTGISNGGVTCVQIPRPQPLVNQSCAASNEYVVGFDATGHIICGVP